MPGAAPATTRFENPLYTRNANRYHLLMHPTLEAPRTLPPTRPAAAPKAYTRPREIPSDQLLGVGRELYIEHRGRLYRLRITQSGKLILTA